MEWRWQQKTIPLLASWCNFLHILNGYTAYWLGRETETDFQIANCVSVPRGTLPNNLSEVLLYGLSDSERSLGGIRLWAGRSVSATPPFKLQLQPFNPTQWTLDQRYASSCPLTIWHVCRWGRPLGQALVSLAGRDHPLHLPTDGPVGQAGGQVHHGPHRGSHLPEVWRAIFCSVRTSSCCPRGCQELHRIVKGSPYVSKDNWCTHADIIDWSSHNCLFVTHCFMLPKQK